MAGFDRAVWQVRVGRVQEAIRAAEEWRFREEVADLADAAEALVDYAKLLMHELEVLRETR